MVEQYKILYRGGQAELIEKKSRFLAFVQPVSSEEEAIRFIETTKKKYWDASHNCSAYIVGERGQVQRCSDDGEPSQTAGRPMLDVLLGAGVHDLCAVVTRYFGGTLLGTGGLVRAYSGAVQQALKEGVVIDKIYGRKLSVVTDYNDFGKLQYLLNQLGVTTLETIYTDQVETLLLLPVTENDRISDEIIEGTHGRAVITALAELYYGILDKQVIIFPE